ncbi:MAG TPA: nucleoside recognition domain-containing protein [Ferrovibrio sp.]|uniref:nucleoside recognition domain-containing protein n=1 Tax=Ferrovibrio sp. TaxID=1917215 RepID=UPI002ED402B3
MTAYLRARLVTSLSVFWQLLRITVPVMLIVRLAEELGLIALMAPALSPVMAVVGLPPEAGLVWLATLTVGIYGGLGALPLLADLPLSVAQISILSAMMLIAHALPIEQAIVRKAGASFWATGALRFGTAVLYGAIVSAISGATGWLAGPAETGLLRAMAPADADWIEWLISSAASLAITFAIIVGLIVLLDLMERSGITRRLTQALQPVLRVSGLSADMAPVTTVGVLLGLTYGGGLIIKEARERDFTPKARVLALSWISLSHSLIEDTGVVLAIGADLWVVLAGRVLLTLLLVRLLATLMDALPRAVRWLAV